MGDAYRLLKFIVKTLTNAVSLPVICMRALNGGGAAVPHSLYVLTAIDVVFM
jgi:hypothetical protein